MRSMWDGEQNMEKLIRMGTEMRKKEKYGEKGIKVSGKKKDGGTRNMRNGNEKNEKDCSKLGLKNCFDLQVKLGSRSKQVNKRQGSGG